MKYSVLVALLGLATADDLELVQLATEETKRKKHHVTKHHVARHVKRKQHRTDSSSQTSTSESSSDSDHHPYKPRAGPKVGLVQVRDDNNASKAANATAPAKPAAATGAKPPAPVAKPAVATIPCGSDDPKSYWEGSFNTFKIDAELREAIDAEKKAVKAKESKEWEDKVLTVPKKKCGKDADKEKEEEASSSDQYTIFGIRTHKGRHRKKEKEETPLEYYRRVNKEAEERRFNAKMKA